MKAKSKSVIVTVADDALPNIDDVAKKLRAKGLKIKSILPVTGVISGQCPIDRAEDLKSVAGVHSVEEDQPVKAI